MTTNTKNYCSIYRDSDASVRFRQELFGIKNGRKRTIYNFRGHW